MKPALEVAVVGGGWAGLAAAVELCDAGAKVTLFEAAKQLGGRARSVDAGGVIVDNGQHILIGAYRETLRLMRKVGADPDALLHRRRLDLDYPGARFGLRLPRLPAPLNLGVGLLAARGCSLGEKRSAARFMRALAAAGYRLPADCSVAELLDRNGQRGALRSLLWESLCLAALNTPSSEASAQIFVNVLRDSLGGDRADTDVLLPAAPLGSVFPEHAARFVQQRGGTIELATRIGAIDRSLQLAGRRFDHIVVATAPQHAQALLTPIVETATTAALLGTYAYEPIATAYLSYAPQLHLPRAMLGLADRSLGGIGHWAFDHGALSGRDGLVAFVISARGPWQALDNDTLAAALHAQLQAVLGKSLASPRWQFVVREKRATFACRPDLPRPATRTALRGLWLAGDYVSAGYPATLEGAVRSGVAAAQALVTSAR